MPQDRPVFEVKEGEANYPCHIFEESCQLIIRLEKPATLEHAEAVSKFLGSMHFA